MSWGSMFGIPPKDCAVEGVLWFIDEMDCRPGDRLPPERELCEKIGVSRTALRSGIAALISRGVLESRQGSGTYVCPRKPVNVFQNTYSFSSVVRAAGLEPSSRTIYAKVVPADEVASAELAINKEVPVFELQRVRSADGRPVSIETTRVRLDRYPGLDEYDFENRGLFDVLREEYGVDFVHGSEHISITRLNKHEAQLMGAEEGSPAFFQRSQSSTADRVPVESCRSVLLPGRYRFASNGAYEGLALDVGEAWLKSL